MRALFMGLTGPFSHIVLERILSAGVNVVGALLAGRSFRPLPALLPESTGAGAELPLLNPHISVDMLGSVDKAADAQEITASQRMVGPIPANPLRLALRAGIPVYECGDLGQTEAMRWLEKIAPDVVCVACWNRIIPQRALAIPRHGFLNAHPSLLPAYRGPYPLFWQFRAGEAVAGVTVHWMDAGLDTGDIAGRRTIHFADGIRAAEAEAQCASAGGALLAEVLMALSQGEAARQPQPAGGSYFPAPTVEDFALDAGWSARRAFNFMRATAEWGIPFRLDGEGAARWLSDALDWREGAPSDSVPDGRAWVRFRDGVLLAAECRGAPE